MTCLVFCPNQLTFTLTRTLKVAYTLKPNKLREFK